MFHIVFCLGWLSLCLFGVVVASWMDVCNVLVECDIRVLHL
jgi:hypothetical protein